MRRRGLHRRIDYGARVDARKPFDFSEPYVMQIKVRPNRHIIGPLLTAATSARPRLFEIASTRRGRKHCRNRTT